MQDRCLINADFIEKIVILNKTLVSFKRDFSHQNTSLNSYNKKGSGNPRPSG